MSKPFSRCQIQPDVIFVTDGARSHIGKLPRAQLWKNANCKGFTKHPDENHKISGKSFHSFPRQGLAYHTNLENYSSFEAGIKPSFMASLRKKFDELMLKGFGQLGFYAAKHTSHFIVIPLLMALLFATGIQRIQYITDPEYLFAPINGPAKFEKAFIETNFPTNYSSKFDPSRITDMGRFARFIITAKDKDTLFRKDVWDDIEILNGVIESISIDHEGITSSYKDICAIFSNNCFENSILKFSKYIPQIESGSLDINYPVYIDSDDFSVYILPMHFGGINVNSEKGIMKSATAVILQYWLRSGNEEERERSRAWELAVGDKLQSANFSNITIARFTSNTLEDELEKNTTSVIPYLGVTVALMVIFSICSLLMSDCVRSKPHLGLIGILSALFACTMAFGLLMYAGVPFIGLNLAAPFLMMGIGIDDMFIMMAAWRRTSIQDPVEERLRKTYSEVSVSITITTLTDMVSFYIGVITPFPSVQIFCLYTGTAVITTYLWYITFFGGCMAIAGRMEANQQHAVCFNIVKAKSVSEEENKCCYTLCCAGGINSDDPWNPRDNKPHVVMMFFKTHLGPALNLHLVKGLVILLFSIYIGGAIYGCTQLQEGLERKRLSRYDSYSVDYYDAEDMYFREYPYRIQVAISGDVRYSDPETKQKLLDLHTAFENETFVASSLYTDSWIRGWYDFLDNNAQFLNVSTDNEEDFLKELREIYLKGDDNVYSMDVKFNDNFTRILASRFIIQTYQVYDSNDDKDMMEIIRRIAKESEFNVTVYHPHFVFFDQYVLVRWTSIKTVSIAAAIMMFVAFIFIPKSWSTFWIGFSIISIEIGVIGYMSLWGVNLDSISMINLIMCIGFSVDFTAHISYAYLSAEVNSSRERIVECLYALGFPILQGALSTIVSVLVLLFAPSYIFLTFFKTVFLVITFGAMHGLFLLPVLLSLFDRKDRKLNISESSFGISNSNDRAFNLQVYHRQNIQNRLNKSKNSRIALPGDSSNESSLSRATGISSGSNTSSTTTTQVSKFHSNDEPKCKCSFINKAFTGEDDSSMKSNKRSTDSGLEKQLNKPQREKLEASRKEK